MTYALDILLDGLGLQSVEDRTYLMIDTQQITSRHQVQRSYVNIVQKLQDILPCQNALIVKENCDFREAVPSVQCKLRRMKKYRDTPN